MLVLNYYFNYVKCKNDKKGTFLCLHDFQSNQNTFNGIIDSISEKYDYYSLNLPGHSIQEKNLLTKKEFQDQLNVKSIVNFIIAFIKNNDLKDLIILGHSFGAALATLVQNKEPNLVKKLILISPYNWTILFHNKLFKKIYFSKNIDKYNEYQICLYKNISYCSTTPSWWIESKKRFEFTIENYDRFWFLYKQMKKISNMLSYHDAIRKNATPTLVILGKFDTLLNYKKNQRYFSNNLKCGKVQILEHSGHFPHIEQTNETIDLIFKFLNNQLI